MPENPLFVAAWEKFKEGETYASIFSELWDSGWHNHEIIEAELKKFFQTGWNARPLDDCKPDKLY